FINKLNYNNIKNKGYKYENIKTQNGTFTVYTISRDLFDNYYPSYKLNIISFITTFIILVIIFWLFEKNKIFAINSIATILRKDIFLSAILPILIVCFVFYLFVLEESNVKKAELIFNLNKQINDLESREFYYSSFCNYLLKNLHNYKDIKDNLERIKNTKDKERKEECNSLSDNLKNKIVGTNYKNNIYGFKSTDPYITIKEIFFVGKDGWIASAIENNNQNKKSSPFGDLFSKIVKAAFFDRNNNINKKVSNEDLSGEYISEKLLEVLSSAYGNEVALKATNLPNNLIIVSNTFTSIGVYIGCFPEINNPDYILGALIYFENDFKSYVCNKRNDNLISYKEHLASGSVDNKLFCFYSPNINVGVYFFYDTWFKNRKEDVKTVKELCLASSWINSSYLPLSKKVDIKGKHLLEARQGNFVKDTVYASLGSEYPIKANKNNRIKSFAQVILFSLLIIFLIAQSIISDLLDPVKQLINGAIEVSKGNYKFRINFLRKDEFGTLCFSFDKMMKGLEEKQLMNRMVSKTALKVASNLSEIQSKKEEVILLYISIPNFDKIMKNTPSYELFAKLRKHIASISEIIIDNGGDIDKIMGEKLLIAFHINDSSIKEVAIKVSKIAKLIATNDSLSFDVSVGVNSGLVISGYLGVGEKRDFTIIGDPVNVAARIESQAEKLETNRCLISETFYNIVRESVNAELFGEVGLKGKSEPMKVYQLF
ncbi:MAG: HAMP domain-containing protein, partial [Candidatus Riflebacteria bacterium]|nr:HAMP domain-containing protein [Candidatus Riflebacteria bacterium]